MSGIQRKHLSPAERHEQIIRAADTVLQIVGVNEFTIDKVVEYLGIAKGTVYKYFETKDDVLAEVASKALTQLLNYFKMSERNAPEGIEKTRAVMMACYHYGADCPKYFELIVYLERPEFKTIAESHKRVSQKLQDFFSNHIVSQQAKGYVRKNLEPVMANYLAWGSSMGIMQFLEAKKVFLEGTEQLTQKELMEAFVDVMVRGMKA